MRDTVCPSDVGDTVLCKTYFDRGPQNSDYDEELFSTRGNIVVPLELDVPLGTALAEQHLLFLCNRDYALTLDEDPDAPPEERSTSRDNVVALTLPSTECPFIVSEQPK